ncbi:MAG: GNAT family N-acetyltransferase [Armatimonadota bacterium]|nr:GNAT family N-acetyltransferase [Armatimonadota bacterium]MDR7485468.1 GNAT family N-acetyltransferase [Armatimonadota bacterium]MDR7533013.1 GNAT family N-acetyltransferase [Armatimonadota bacterium]MDR7536815.1 GNAT family N-acetyltransferase [Armatimonadota bacterium]
MARQVDEGQYPGHREGDVVLRDGSTVHLRPVRRTDEAALLTFFRALSEQARALRFFTRTSDEALGPLVNKMVAVDYRRRYGIVATVGTPERIIGHAMYATLDGDRAEVAFAVADDYQGRGLGTLMLGHLAEHAAECGIRLFEAEVLPTNLRMLEVFRNAGFPTEVQVQAGEVHERFPTALTPEALARFDEREMIAAASALRTFFSPRAVAVVGASRQRGSIGGELFHNLLAYGFAGPVYPVNPRADVVQSVVAYPTVEAIPGPVDLAVVVVPAEHVVETAQACARKGVRALVVISAGFAEVGEAGRARQADLLRVCRAAGMRLIGPNCMGIINTDPTVRLNATFAPVEPPEGRIGFMSQSGALGLAILDYARMLGLGVSTFVSVGNKADISGNDLLAYWEQDPRTDVILLYLESFGNPRKFSRIARRVGRRKPIVAVKSGRTRAGVRATSSHTGALLAASDITVDALFRQAGVIRTDTLEEMFDVAALLAHQPVPAGPRVGIITNSGGPGILCADTCEAEGLEVPVLSEETRRALRAFLPGEAAVSNPVDMIASATAEHYRQAIRVVGRDPGIDALVVIFIPPLVTRADEVAAAIVDAVRELGGTKPVLSVFMSSRGTPEVLRASDVRVPSYLFPEAAAIALARVARYGQWRARPLPAPVRFEGLRRDDAATLVDAALARGEGWLEPGDVQALLECYGLRMVEQRIVPTADAAALAAEEFGGSVALKAIVPGVVHRTEVGAVRLNLEGREAVARAAVEITARLQAAGAAPTGFVVQKMAAPGVEMIAGVVHDPQFGPVVACGAGGVLVELMGDVAIRLAPLSREDTREMLEGLKTYRLLTGFRGQPPADVAALEDVLLRLGALAEDLPAVAELDCNPVIVHERGATIVDVRVRIARPEPAVPLGARRR